MNLPWTAGEMVPPDEFRKLQRDAIFRFHKWDQQVGDTATFCPFPLLMDNTAWAEVSGLAEALAKETQLLEDELLQRTEIWNKLGLPLSVVQVLQGRQTSLSVGRAQLIRFDFHFTTEGWKISEANTDVPGGWNEATAYPALMAPFYSKYKPAGSFINLYAQSLPS